MVKLTPQQQASYLGTEPDVFGPASGDWGRGGATLVQLAGAEEGSVWQALKTAWSNTAPKRLAEQFDED